LPRLLDNHFVSEMGRVPDERIVHMRIQTIAFTALALAACANQPVDPNLIGSAQAAIKSVPSDVSCVQITVVGSSTVQRNFDVTPGATSVVKLDLLPLGTVTFYAAAYNGACSSLTSDSTATWLGDSVAATIVPGALTSVLINLHKNGAASVSLDFDSDAGTCTPSCGTKVCGGDGCGGSCGTCAGGQTCGSDGTCQPHQCTCHPCGKPTFICDPDNGCICGPLM
jgi:hypothetical protein